VLFREVIALPCDSQEPECILCGENESFLGAFAKLRKATVRHVCLSACNNSALTGGIFMKFDIREFLENVLRKFKFHYNLTRIGGTLHEDRREFVVLPRWILLRMKNVSDISCRDNENTILYSIIKKSQWFNGCKLEAYPMNFTE
jgi:hypothetical protein